MRQQLHIAAPYLSANDAALQKKTLIQQVQEHLSTLKAEFLFHNQKQQENRCNQKAKQGNVLRCI